MMATKKAAKKSPPPTTRKGSKPAAAAKSAKKKAAAKPDEAAAEILELLRRLQKIQMELAEQVLSQPSKSFPYFPSREMEALIQEAFKPLNLSEFDQRKFSLRMYKPLVYGLYPLNELYRDLKRRKRR